MVLVENRRRLCAATVSVVPEDVPLGLSPTSRALQYIVALAKLNMFNTTSNELKSLIVMLFSIAMRTPYLSLPSLVRVKLFDVTMNWLAPLISRRESVADRPDIVTPWTSYAVS
jgi:hypothetical protein